MNETERCPSCGDTFPGEEGCLAPPVDTDGTIYLDEPEILSCACCAAELNTEAERLRSPVKPENHLGTIYIKNPMME